MSADTCVWYRFFFWFHNNGRQSEATPNFLRAELTWCFSNTRVSHRQKRGGCRRTCTRRGGPNQRSIIPSEPRLAGGQPTAHRRVPGRAPDATWRGSPRRMCDPGLSHWRCTGLRQPVHQKERAREVSESPAESAVEVAECSESSALQRGFTQSPGV